ncbi:MULTISPECIES: hypothetical protein [Sphingobacterium]|uniref:Universal stress protein family protein n=2 Tax=Sphingobacterium TaxID=28453 RepID=A0ABW5YY84_9SPHI|nr:MULTISPECIES: hypothetical protein [Sphingobacterium]MCW2260773.1 hypothetical protein [Sphingobacterium kitahiroshimense]NJI75702.1 hypothetical protein [Sphingobacterium sp. B16(2022)]QQD13339.1 hypothetical protein JAZ75_22540 [Sphingobacterium sp. UDSM-2020]TCR09071.1 hypothetical protein EDF67_106237 [Sphingobacterium sp. JUb78]
MKKRILIPSDFTIDSLLFVIQSLEHSKAKEVEVVLVYGNRSSTSISELLGIKLEDQLSDLHSEDFIKACQMICNRYEDRKLVIYTDIIGTDNSNYLHNYLLGAKIDEIRVPSNYAFEKRTKHFFDVGKVLLRLNARKLGQVGIIQKPGTEKFECNVLSDLFFKKKWDVNY